VSDLVVRRLDADAEIDAYFRLAAGTFGSAPEPESRGPEWRREHESAPWHRPEQLRGAFRASRLVGGYVIGERRLIVGGARLLTGCIAGVVVREEQRKLGVGRALMHDAIAFAEANRHALLLLDGIPGFYQKFGYADVFDPTWHALKRAEVQRLEPSPCVVRPSTDQDAAALLDLYRRHVGAFDRTVEEVHWRLVHWDRPAVAVDTAARVRGYMSPPRGDAKERVGEVVADDWPAALALLHHHAELSPAEELAWSIPPRAPLLYWLIDRLDVRSTTSYSLNGWWMARPAHLPTLLEAMTPLWRERWPGPGPLPDLSALSPKLLVQLLFGFRPAETVDPALEPLFPFGRFWIPSSDQF
jgi:GNAT superfamily N-acetyltransferase